MTDISDLTPGDRTIEILHPKTGEPIGLRVTMVSIDDERLKPLKRRFADRRLHLEARGKHLQAEEIEENADSLLFASVVDWQWYAPNPENPNDIASFEGEQPEWNRRNFNRVANKLEWFKDQLKEALGETKAFFAN